MIALTLVPVGTCIRPVPVLTSRSDPDAVTFVPRIRSRFCGPSFTIGDLRNVYEVVWGHKLDPRNFNRKVLNTAGFVEPTGERRIPEVGRPAALYRAGAEEALNPPLLRVA